MISPISSSSIQVPPKAIQVSPTGWQIPPGSQDERRGRPPMKGVSVTSLTAVTKHGTKSF